MPRYLIIIFCFIIVLGLGVGLIWPKYNSIKSLGQEVSWTSQELEYQETYSTAVRKAWQELEERKDIIEKIDTALPSSVDLAGLFEYFQKISGQNGLTLQTIGAPAIISSSEINGKEISLLLSLSGSYVSLKNFLLTLYQSSRLIEVETISFNTPLKGDRFDFNIKIKMYSY